MEPKKKPTGVKKQTPKTSTKSKKKQSFDFKDITDIHISIQFGDKIFPFIAKADEDQEELKQMRLTIIKILSETHMVYPKSVDEIFMEGLEEETQD
jgi:hypothetical protein